MRWLRLNCILLAGLAILLATEAESSRHKRDLSYVKNFIKTAIFGSQNKTNPSLVLVNSGENYKIFRIPGFDNVLVKAVPKMAGTVSEKVELVSPEDSKVGIVASYLGTKTQSETLNALQGVKTLLGSGILTATKDQAVPVGPLPPLPPHLELIAVGEGTFEKPHILLDTSSLCEEVQADEKPVVVQQPTIWQGHPFLSIFQRPIQFPTIFKPIGPVKVPVPTLPTKYSYKQLHGDGKVTTYTANDDQNVIVTQSEQPGPLPPVVTYRIQEVMKLGAHGMQGFGTIPVFAGNIQRPIIQHFTSPKVNPYRPVQNNYSYKQIHNDGTVTSYASGLKGDDVVVMEGGKVPVIPSFISHRIETITDSAATGKQPNPVVLAGLNVAQAQWYNPLLYGHQIVDTKGGVQVSVDAKVQQDTQQNTGSQGTYSYQTIHKDGSVTNYGVGSSVFSKPENYEIKPVSPTIIKDRLQTISKTSGGSYSYKILHNDGSMTNYGAFGIQEKNKGDSKMVPFQKTKPETSQQNIFVSENKGTANQPDINYKGTSGYSYKRIHSDGSVTSYSSNGVDEINGKNSENQFRGDGLQKTYNENLHINLNNQQHAGMYSHDTYQTNGQHASNADSGSKSSELAFHQNSFHAPKIGNPSPGSFTYKVVHGDGSVSIYSQNEVKEINEQQKFTDSNKLQQSVIALGTSESNKQNVQGNTQGNAGVIFNNQNLKQNGHARTRNNAVPASNVFSYTANHNDGSRTIYSQNGVKDEKSPFKNEDQSSSSAVSVKQPESNQFIEGSTQNKDLDNQAGKHNIYVSSQNNIGLGYDSFSYKAIHNDGSKTIYSQNGVKEENAAKINKNQQASDSAYLINRKENNQQNAHEQNVVIPVSGSFSYKAVHNDGSMTIFSQNNVKQENTALRNENHQSISIPSIHQEGNNQYLQASARSSHNSGPGSFSYKAVHSDGLTTIYSENGIKEEKVPLKNKNLMSSADGNQQRNYKNNHVSVQNIVFPVSGSFSYKTVHNDGSMTTYSQKGVKEENKASKNQQLSSVAGNSNYQEGNKQYLQVSVPNNDGAAFNEQAVQQNIHVNAHNSGSGSFSYKTVHSDGSTTIYSQNGVKEENVPFKNKNPQSSSAAGFNQQRKNTQNIVRPVSGSFSYKAVHNDGSKTTYTQSGVQSETDAKESNIEGNKYYNKQSQKSVNDVKVNMNEQQLHTNQQNKGTLSPSSFSYKAVHSDGSETNYLGQTVEEIKVLSQNNPVNALIQQNLSNKHDEVTEEMNVHTNTQYNSKPSGSFSYKTVHGDGSVSNIQSESSQQDVKNQDQTSTAFEDEQKIQIIPPAPKLPELSSDDLPVTPVNVLVADSNKVLFTKPVVSSYSYKQINHHSPDQFKVAVNIGDTVSTESEFKVSAQVAASASTNEAATGDTIPKDYVYIPPANVNEPPPIKPLIPKHETSTEKQTPPSVVVLAPVDVVPCGEKSLSEHPIVVLDEPMKYSYQQRKTDGSAIHVESDQSFVSVNISSKERVGNRGDIPESP